MDKKNNPKQNLKPKNSKENPKQSANHKQNQNNPKNKEKKNEKPIKTDDKNKQKKETLDKNSAKKSGEKSPKESANKSSAKKSGEKSPKESVNKSSAKKSGEKSPKESVNKSSAKKSGEKSPKETANKSSAKKCGEKLPKESVEKKSSKEKNTKNKSKDSDKKGLIKAKVLPKTTKKALIPHREFELSVKKIKKLEDKGYRDLIEIGQGSYGKIYKAKSDKHKKRVAIKAIDLNRLSQMFLEKFLSVEIELMRKLPDHQNVAKCYEVIEGTDDHMYSTTSKNTINKILKYNIFYPLIRLYEVMDLYPNGDLYDYLLKRPYIPERQACIWYKQLISGLEHIHKNGYAHRDIKSENLLLDDKYVIRIIDFGFCCRLRYETKVTKEENSVTNSEPEEYPSKTFCGSYIYASPELLKGRPYLPTMEDIWGSGVILYVMLFGSYPNDATELEKFIRKDDHFIEIPTYPEVSYECKELLNNILVNERNRYSINNIKESDWFKKEWEEQDLEQDMDINYYFQNLNIRRVETEAFTVIEGLAEEQAESESDLKHPTDLKH